MKRKIALAMAVSMLITSVPVNSLTGLAEEAVIVEDVIVEDADLGGFSDEIPGAITEDTVETESESELFSESDLIEEDVIFVESIEVMEETLEPVLELNTAGEDPEINNDDESVLVPKVEGLEDVDLNKATSMTPSSCPAAVSLKAGEKIVQKLTMEDHGIYEWVYSLDEEYSEDPKAHLYRLYEDGEGCSDGAINPESRQTINVPEEMSVYYIVIAAYEDVDLQINMTYTPATFTVQSDNEIKWDPTKESVDLIAEVIWADKEKATGLSYEWSPWGHEETINNTTNTFTVTKEAVNNGARGYICAVTDGITSRQIYYSIKVDSSSDVVDNNFAVDWGDSSFIKAVKPDEEFTLTAPVTGDDLTGITWNWYKDYVSDETLISGAVSDTLVLSNLTESAFYHFVARDKYGNEAADSFWVFLDTLTVENEGQNINVPAVSGKSAELTVVAESWYRNDQITYQWQENVEVDGEWIFQDIADQASDTLKVTYDGNDKTYRCKITDGTDSAYVDFQIVMADTTIELEYEEYHDIDFGEDLELSVTASSIDDDYEYKWYYRLRYDTEYTPITDAVTNTYKIENSKFIHEAYYKCEVYNKYTTEPATAEFTVYTNGIEDALDFDEEYYVTLSAGQENVLTFESSSDPEGTCYQWFNDEGLMVGQTSSELTLPSDLEEGDYKYYCEVYNDQDLDTVWFYVDVESISLAYEDYQEVIIGNIIELSVTAKAVTDKLSYRWQVYNNITCEYDDIQGATNSVYETGYLNSFGNHYYKCIVSDGTNIKEADIDVYVTGIEEDLELEYKESAELLIDKVTGNKLTVTAVAAVDKTPVYQWYIQKYSEETGENWEPIEGATSLEFTFTEELEKGEYVYKCVVNVGTDEDTASFHVTVGSGLKVEQVYPLKANPGVSTTLEVKATSQLSENISFQWYEWCDDEEDYVAIPGAVNSTLSIIPYNYIDYECEVSDDFTSQRINFWMNTDSELVVSYDDSIRYVPYGETVTLSVDASTKYGNEINYSWVKAPYDDSVGTNSNEYTFTVTESATYRCSIEDGYKDEIAEFHVCVQTGLSVKDKKENIISIDNASSSTVLEVTATTSDEYGPVAYEWMEWNPDDWEFERTGITESSFTAENITTEVKLYRCYVSDQYNEEYVEFYVGNSTSLAGSALYADYAADIYAEQKALVVIPVDNSHMWFKFKPETNGKYSFTKENINSDSYSEEYYRIYDSQLKLLKSWSCYYDSKLTYEFAADKDYYIECGNFYGNNSYYLTVSLENSNICVHNYPEEWTEISAATCTEDGIKSKTCTKCSDTITETILATGHSYGEELTAETDTEIKVYKVCSVCEAEKIISVTSKNNTWEDTTYELWVTAGDDITLNGISGDLTGLYFTWHMTDKDNDNTTLDNKTSTLVVEGISHNVTYDCDIYDGTNFAKISFEIKVDSGLIPGEKHIELDTVTGSEITLDPGITAYKGTELSYLWEAFDWTDNSVIELEENDVEKLTIACDKGSYYFCTISDQYGNERWLRYWVSVMDPYLNLEYDYNGKTVAPGEYTTLEVTANTNCQNKEDISYQWYLLKTNYDTYEDDEYIIEDATSASYSTNVAGRYLCRVSLNGMTEEANFHIDYDPDPSVEYNYIPEYDLEPGETVELWVTIGEHNIKDVEEIEYQWYVSEYNEDTYEYDLIEAIEDATESTYVTDQSGCYTCIAAIGPVTREMSMKVNLLISDPYIILERDYENMILPGEDTTLEFTSIQTNIPYPENARYQWYSMKYDSDLEEYVECKIDGATSSSYTTNIVGNYVCKVTIGGFSETSEFCVSYSENPTIRLTYESDHTVAIGTPLTLGFEEVYTNILNYGEMDYQWYILKYDEEDEEVLIPIPDATDSTCEIVAAGDYVCEVSIVNEVVGEVSRRADFYVEYAEGSDPDATITLEKTEYELNILMNNDQDVILSTNVTDYTGTLNYEWYKFVDYNEEDEDVYDEIPDETDASLNLGILNQDGYYTYKCVVSNEYTSKVIKYYISVGSGLKLDPQMPYHNTVKPGESITLALKAESALSDDFEFAWYYEVFDYETGEGTVIPGAVQEGNTSTLTFTPEKSGIVNYRVTDGYTYSYYRYYIYVNSGFEIEESDDERTYYGDLGSNVTMQVNAVSDYPEKLTYLWYEREYVDGEVVKTPVSTSDTCVVKVSSANKEYCCEISDGYNTETVFCRVELTKMLKAEAEQSVLTVEEGQNAVLKVNASTDPSYGTVRYRWDYYGDTVSEEGNTYTVENVTEAMVYHCYVSDDYHTTKVTFIIGLPGEFDNSALDFASAVEIKAGEMKTAYIPLDGTSMFFKFVPEKSGCYFIYSDHDDGADTYVDLYDADRKHLADDDDGNYDYNFGLKYEFKAGETYYIEAHYNYNDSGSYPVGVEFTGGCVECSWDEGTITKEPTCTEEGEKTYVCTVCGTVSTEVIEFAGHVFDDWQTENEPTCTEKGSEYCTCTVCGIIDRREIEEAGHSYIKYKEGEESETAKVIRTYQKCKTCDHEVTLTVVPKGEEQAVIDTAGSEMNTLLSSTDETVNVTGAVTAVTNMDNQILIDIEEVSEENMDTAMKHVTDLEEKLLKNKNADITGLIGESAPKDSTAEEPTISENVSVSGAAVTVAKALMEAANAENEEDRPDAETTYSAQLEVKDKTSENPEPGVYTVDISLNIIATKDGVSTEFREGIEPSAPIYITIPVPEAFWNSEFDLKHVTESGTVEVNYVKNDNQTISFYAASLSDWILDVTECAVHDYAADEEQSVAPSCQSGGKNVTVCGTCGDVKTEMLAKTSHSWSAWSTTTAATCTENGTKVHNCINDGCTVSESMEIPKLGHKFSESYTVDKAPTCTENGSESRHCERCTDVYDQTTIPASGNHSWKTVVDKAATCGTAGSQHRECTVSGCGYKEAATSIPATGSHSWKTVVDKAATCGTAGSQHRECTVCGTKEAASSIPATGNHNWTNVVDKAATCGAAGSQHKECSVCHAKQAATSISATGNHIYGSYTVTTAPTVLKAGWETARCNNCSATTGREVAKLEGTIKLSAKTLKLQIKKSVILTSLVTGLSAGDSIKSWSVDKKGKSYVTLNSKGKVTGKKAGTAKITVTLASGKSAVITLTVQKKAVTTSKVTVANKKIELKVGKSTTLKPIITPITSFEKATYKTSNKKVATVSSKGKVTAKGAGTATITIKVGKKTCKVTVKVPAPELKSIKLSATKKTLKKGKSFTLKVTLNPKTATDKITYATSNKKVATVDKKGKVTAKGKGTATITVKAGKFTKTCKITVN